jgi:hypothetical protein
MLGTLVDSSSLAFILPFDSTVTPAFYKLIPLVKAYLPIAKSTESYSSYTFPSLL